LLLLIAAAALAWNTSPELRNFNFPGLEPGVAFITFNTSKVEGQSGNPSGLSLIEPVDYLWAANLSGSNVWVATNLKGTSKDDGAYLYFFDSFIVDDCVPPFNYQEYSEGNWIDLKTGFFRRAHKKPTVVSFPFASADERRDWYAKNLPGDGIYYWNVKNTEWKELNFGPAYSLQNDYWFEAVVASGDELVNSYWVDSYDPNQSGSCKRYYPGYAALSFFSIAQQK